MGSVWFIATRWRPRPEFDVKALQYAEMQKCSSPCEINLRTNIMVMCPPSILIVSGRCIRDPCTPMMVHIEQAWLAQNSIAPLIDTFIWMIDACLRSSRPFHNIFRTGWNLTNCSSLPVTYLQLGLPLTINDKKRYTKHKVNWAWICLLAFVQNDCRMQIFSCIWKK